MRENELNNHPSYHVHPPGTRKWPHAVANALRIWYEIRILPLNLAFPILPLNLSSRLGAVPCPKIRVRRGEEDTPVERGRGMHDNICDRERIRRNHTTLEVQWTACRSFRQPSWVVDDMGILGAHGRRSRLLCKRGHHQGAFRHEKALNTTC